MSNCQNNFVQKKRKKGKFSAGGSDMKKECIIHVLDAPKIMWLTSSQQILGSQVHGLT